MKTINLDLGKNSYPILIGSDIRNMIDDIFRQLNIGSEITIITHPHLRTLYGNNILNTLNTNGYNASIYEIESGETIKSHTFLFSILDHLLEKQIERTHTIVALGGGVIGDLAGFASAITLRGINLIQIPTTLLAQVDASIGGKTGINHAMGKNLIGSFYQPKATICDISTLTTLPKKEILAGLAEVVKYGVIYDPNFFKYLEDNAEELRELSIKKHMDIWEHIVYTSAKIKAEVVSKDERESNLRALLNFGHTVGHAIEKVTEYKVYLHGEAVALGMVSASHIAKGLGLWTDKHHNRLISLLNTLNFTIKIDRLSVDSIYNALYSDKKVKNKKLRFILPREFGKIDSVTCEDDALIKESIQLLFK